MGKVPLIHETTFKFNELIKLRVVKGFNCPEQIEQHLTVADFKFR